MTRPDGSFTVEGLRPGRYYARASYVGYTPLKTAAVSVGAPGASVELGALKLAADAVALEGIQVTGERRDVRLAPDRNTYAVRDMPAATTGGTAVDVLRNVPSVEVDGSNNVSLRGNQNVVVQINGRPTPMRGEQLGNFLAQLPANMVEKVDVIPNPSAKYDPEGMAGIINIALKQNTDLGTSGGLTVGGGSTGQVNASGNLGYQKGALTLFGSYGFMNDHRETTGYTNRQILGETTLPYTYLYQDASGTMSPLSNSFNGSAEYELGERDALSSNLIVNQRRFERSSDNFNRQLDASLDPLALARQTNEGTSDGQMFDWTLQYKHTVQPQLNEWSTEVRYNRSSDSNVNLLTDQPLTFQEQPAGATPALHSNDTDSHTGNWTLQSDLTRMLGERTKLETGYKGTLRRMDNDLAVADYSYDLGAYVPDLAQSNAFEYRELVNAVYGVLSQNVGKFDLQGGLRLEKASSNFDLRTTDEAYDNDYSSFFPSALAAYNLDDSKQLKLSYSKRIERPDTRQLNPFAFYEDQLNVFRGNPRLQPEYTHAFEAGYQQSFEHGSLQLTPFYRHTVDAVRRIRSLEESGVSVTTFENVATSNSYGADVTGSLRLGPLNGFGGFSAFKQVTDGSNLTTDVSNSAFGWSARANAGWKLSPKLDAQGFFMYRAPMNTEQGRISAMSFLSVGLRQKLVGDRASVSLRVMDPFNTMGFGSVTEDPAFYLETQRKFGARGVYLSFNYNFGKAPRLRQQRPEQPQVPQDETGMPQ
jgi:outer membrane receptor protein involved in Fe transport